MPNWLLLSDADVVPNFMKHTKVLFDPFEGMTKHFEAIDRIARPLARLELPTAKYVDAIEQMTRPLVAVERWKAQHLDTFELVKPLIADELLKAKYLEAVQRVLMPVAAFQLAMSEQLEVIERVTKPLRGTLELLGQMAEMQAKIFGPTFEFFDRLRERGFSHEEELELLMDCAESAAGEWERVVERFGLKRDDLPAFFLVVTAGTWRTATKVVRYVFNAVRREQGEDARPLLGARARQPPRRVTLDGLEKEDRPQRTEALVDLKRAGQRLLIAAGKDRLLIELRLDGLMWAEIQERLRLSDRQREAARKRVWRLLAKLDLGEWASQLAVSDQP